MLRFPEPATKVVRRRLHDRPCTDSPAAGSEDIAGEQTLYELFYYPENASLAPHFLLEELGAPFELRLVDRKVQGQKDPQYLKVNPMGRIPALVDDDLVVFESAAICLYLTDRHPEAGLAPPLASRERAHFYKWLIFLTNTVQPDLMAFFYPDQHTIDAGGVAAVKAAAEKRLDAAHAMMDTALGESGPYLLGETLSAADFYLLMLARWGRFLATPPTSLSHIQRCVSLVSSRSAVQRVLAREGLKEVF